MSDDYDARWRMMARYEGSNTDPTEQWVYHHAGLVESGSGSYIDSVTLRDRDTDADGTLDERVYELQNWRADVVALIADDGSQIEQDRYEPYGTPFGIPAGDTDGDGDVDQTDVDQITTWRNAGTYDVRGDLDMDDDVDLADENLVKAAKNNGDTLGRNNLSLVENRKGYAGYELLAELTESKWDVRNRELNSELGNSMHAMRWDSFSTGTNRCSTCASQGASFEEAPPYDGPVIAWPPSEDPEVETCCRKLYNTDPAPMATVCCGHILVTCIYPERLQSEGEGNRLAQLLIINCMLVHESVHHGQLDCSDNNLPTRFPLPSGPHPLWECQAYRAEMGCLLASQGICRAIGDDDCAEAIQHRIDHVQRQIDANCPKPAGGTERD